VFWSWYVVAYAYGEPLQIEHDVDKFSESVSPSARVDTEIMKEGDVPRGVRSELVRGVRTAHTHEL